jgi:hypothetical protein
VSEFLAHYLPEAVRSLASTRAPAIKRTITHSSQPLKQQLLCDSLLCRGQGLHTVGRACTSSAYLSDIYIIGCLKLCSSDTEQPILVRTSLRRAFFELPHWKPCQFGNIHSSLAAHFVSSAIPHISPVTHPHIRSGHYYGLSFKFHWPLLLHRSPALSVQLGSVPDQHRVRLLPSSCLIPHRKIKLC